MGKEVAQDDFEGNYGDRQTTIASGPRGKASHWVGDNCYKTREMTPTMVDLPAW